MRSPRDAKTDANLAISDRQASGRIKPWKQRTRIILYNFLYLGGREAGLADHTDRIEIRRRE